MGSKSPEWIGLHMVIEILEFFIIKPLRDEGKIKSHASIIDVGSGAQIWVFFEYCIRIFSVSVCFLFSLFLGYKLSSFVCQA